jgi:hypothetical protein
MGEAEKWALIFAMLRPRRTMKTLHSKHLITNQQRKTNLSRVERLLRHIVAHYVNMSHSHPMKRDFTYYWNGIWSGWRSEPLTQRRRGRVLEHCDTRARASRPVCPPWPAGRDGPWRWKYSRLPGRAGRSIRNCFFGQGGHRADEGTGRGPRTHWIMKETLP